jgi:ribosomal protein S18 acetylase RimI-like enzyme
MLLRNSTISEIEQALEKNMMAKFSYLPSLNTDMEVIENKNMLIINSNCKADMFNIICKIKKANTKILQNAINFFVKNKLPFAFWLGFKDEAENLKDELNQLNLVCDERELGMYILLDNINNLNGDIEQLKILQVKERDILQDFVSVIITLIPKDTSAIKEFFISNEKLISDKNSKLKLFVGYYKNKPVATSALFCDNQVVGVWDVITLPSARGKGIGTKMTMHTLLIGKQMGYKIGVLTASDLGMGIYSKLGFRPLKDYLVCNYEM